MANLPDTESEANNNAKKKVVKNNQACMTILIASFTENLSVLSCTVETIDMNNYPVGQSNLTMKSVNKMFMPGGIIGDLNQD